MDSDDTSVIPDFWAGLASPRRGAAVRPRSVPRVWRYDARRRSLFERERHAGRLEVARRGVYAAVADQPRWHADTLRTIAALPERLDTDFVVTSTTAAVLVGLWVVRDDGRVHVAQRSSPSGRARRDATIVRHHATVPRDHLRRMGRLLVPSVEWLAIDCARTLPLREALPILDSALVIGASRPEMTRIVGSLVGRRGIRAARFALEHARRSGSPFESQLRADLIDAGLPMPQTLVTIEDEHGRIEHDLAWVILRLSIEAHGDAKYRDGADPRSEAVRRQRTFDAGWASVEVRSGQSRGERVRRIEAAFEAALRRRGLSREQVSLAQEAVASAEFSAEEDP